MLNQLSAIAVWVGQWFMFLAPVILLGLLIYRLLWVTRPLRWMPAGRYPELREHYARYLRPPHRWFGTAEVAHLGIATCHFAEGRPDLAKRQLQKVDEQRLKPALRYTAHCLWANVILEQEEDPREVLRRIGEARGLADSPDLVLMEAHARFRLGERVEARKMLLAVEREHDETRSSSNTMLDRQAFVRRDPRFVAQSVALLRGWLWLLLGDDDHARPLLEEAVSGPPGAARHKSTTLLEAVGGSTTDEEETPPSLKPHTLDAEVEQP